ncbi:hypothetical protein GCM10010508_50010 [Streptomyces naganishii JCM 4654]|uniref:Phosphoglycerate mutase n=1 Tax=Streptomyces naganishii JCM 4654 TaxID=1306179 RepID=A0A918Y8B1_9ACTN|nr:hypothetical protein GCM10010508_50010 [Streptomyces naganishii JCM 4654]
MRTAVLSRHAESEWAWNEPGTGLERVEKGPGEGGRERVGNGPGSEVETGPGRADNGRAPGRRTPGRTANGNRAVIAKLLTTTRVDPRLRPFARS